MLKSKCSYVLPSKPVMPSSVIKWPSKFVPQINASFNKHAIFKNSKVTSRLSQPYEINMSNINGTINKLGDKLTNIISPAQQDRDWCHEILTPMSNHGHKNAMFFCITKIRWPNLVLPSRVHMRHLSRTKPLSINEIMSTLSINIHRNLQLY